MRTNQEPYLIEAVTYRWFGHVDWREDIDVGVTRSKEDVSNWKKRDPIKRLREAMISKKLWSEEEQNKQDDQIKTIVSENWQKALNDNYPDHKLLKKNIYKND